ncbi:excalibur calcium-binding domain-containing protein [Sphingomonas hengshuiensis]|uniref:excalibur calcium-binding domain-containing protein n=1 Tax=Sphingomonas hengshuiensis TaxID=1609977 RepID=UPI001D111003|nr:excalibur calcium-binding domain-containing protein [Sphingomonas hengshuiensis]
MFGGELAVAAPGDRPSKTQASKLNRKNSVPRAREVQKAVYASCADARKAGAAPIRRGDTGYSAKLDRDGDGVACER